MKKDIAFGASADTDTPEKKSSVVSEVLLKILSSASKIVLLMFAGAMIAGLFVGKISEDAFKTIALMVFTFYFSYKGSDTSQPYTGK